MAGWWGGRAGGGEGLVMGPGVVKIELGRVLGVGVVLGVGLCTRMEVVGIGLGVGGGGDEEVEMRDEHERPLACPGDWIDDPIPPQPTNREVTLVAQSVLGLDRQWVLC